MTQNKNTSSKIHQHLDSGWSWVVLFACFLVNILSNGVFSSLGVFLVEWKDQISESLTKLQWILSLVIGIPLIIGPISSAVCKFYSIRFVVITGATLASVAFIAASFAYTTSHLYVTFAVAGIGFGLIFQPSIVILAYYFDKRLARANGLSSAGNSIATFALPPLFQLLINQYGWNGALLIISGLVANSAVFAALYRLSPLEIKNRGDPVTGNHSTELPILNQTTCLAQGSSEDYKIDTTQHHIKQNSCHRFLAIILTSFNFQLLKNLRFFLLFLANFPYGVAYIIVLQYLPARAVHGGIPKIQAALLLSIVGITSLVSRFTHGYLIDYKILTSTMLTATAFLLCAISCALFPISNRYPVLALLSAVVGIASGIFNASILVVAVEYVGVSHVSGAAGLILLTTGAGAFTGLFMTGFLFDVTGSYDLPFFLAGACFMISSLLLFVDPLVRHLGLS